MILASRMPYFSPTKGAATESSIGRKLLELKSVFTNWQAGRWALPLTAWKRFGRK